MFKPTTDWFISHPAIAALVFGLSLIGMVASLVFTPYLLVRIPADYFAHDALTTPARSAIPSVRRLLAVCKNLLGTALLAAGLLMLVTPGQGVLTILAGFALVDIPGKRRLERWIISRPLVWTAANQLRTKYGRPPLKL